MEHGLIPEIDSYGYNQ